jgi:hypothetical protein
MRFYLLWVLYSRFVVWFLTKLSAIPCVVWSAKLGVLIHESILSAAPASFQLEVVGSLKWNFLSAVTVTALACCCNEESWVVGKAGFGRGGTYRVEWEGLLSWGSDFWLYLTHILWPRTGFRGVSCLLLYSSHYQLARNVSLLLTLAKSQPSSRSAKSRTSKNWKMLTKLYHSVFPRSRRCIKTSSWGKGTFLSASFQRGPIVMNLCANFGLGNHKFLIQCPSNILIIYEELIHSDYNHLGHWNLD